MKEYLIVTIFCLFYKNQPISGIETDEQRLYASLFKNYDRTARPIFNSSRPVDVEVKFGLTQVYSVDALRQQMTVTGWLELAWFDEILHWNPFDFGGIEIITVPSNKIWVPPFGVQNSAADVHNADFFEFFQVQIDYHGNVRFEPGGKFTTLCPINTEYYPFDQQNCPIIISGWNNPGSKVNFVSGCDELYLSFIQDNGEWNVIGTRCERKLTVHPCCLKSDYPSIYFILKLKRKPGFYIVNIITPCILLGILDLFVFVLPAESGEKIAMGMTVLLAFSVFSLLIIEQIPKASDGVPVIVQYLTFCMWMAGASVVLSVLILCIYHNSGAKRPPKFLMKHLGRKTRNEIELNDRNNHMQTTGTESNMQNHHQGNLQTFELKEKGEQGRLENIEEWRALAMRIEKICLTGFIITDILAPLAILYIVPSSQQE